MTDIAALIEWFNIFIEAFEEKNDAPSPQLRKVADALSHLTTPAEIAALIERNKDRIARIRNGGWAYEPVMELLQANIDALSHLTPPSAIAGLIERWEKRIAWTAKWEIDDRLDNDTLAALRRLKAERDEALTRGGIIGN